ncbi:MAG: site-2 protease family protein [Clostridia bacterium]|nr:site-2 protease family protein [Clostridia bacterium]
MIFSNLSISELLQNFIVLFTAITVHEYSHGLIANRLGDPTARAMGRLTLNPMAHLDPLGALMMVFCRFGWAKPVPVNPYYFDEPKKGMMFVALAGPASNLLLALLVATIYPFLWMFMPSIFGITTFMGGLFIACIGVNVSFAVFNLIPFPPLDGSKILFSLLPNEVYNKLLTYERYGTVILIVLSFTGVLGSILDLIINPVFGLYIKWINFLLNLIA